MRFRACHGGHGYRARGFTVVPVRDQRVQLPEAGGIDHDVQILRRSRETVSPGWRRRMKSGGTFTSVGPKVPDADRRHHAAVVASAGHKILGR